MVTGRLVVTAAVIVTAAFIAEAVVTAASSAGVLAVVIAAVVAVLGLAGRSANHPVTSSAVRLGRRPETDRHADLDRAFLPRDRRAQQVVPARRQRRRSPTVTDPPRRPGWRADIDLPPGVTAGDVIERRDRLACGLRRPLSSVWPSADNDTHAGRLALYVADKPMSKAKPVSWPLTKTGKVDLFAPIPDRRRPARPARDGHADVRPDDHRRAPADGQDLPAAPAHPRRRPGPDAPSCTSTTSGAAPTSCRLEPVAHRFRTGDDADDLAYLKADVRELTTGHGPALQDDPQPAPRVCPEGKVTRGLADRRDLGLVAMWSWSSTSARWRSTTTPNWSPWSPTSANAARPPGSSSLLATQRVDAKSLPTGISSNAVLRFCLKVTGQVENDMVIGTSMYKAGVRATTFARTDGGVGYLAGEGDEPDHHPHRLPRRHRRPSHRRPRPSRPPRRRPAHRRRRRHRPRPRHQHRLDPRPPRRGLADRSRESLVGRPSRTARRRLSRPLRQLDR